MNPDKPETENDEDVIDIVPITPSRDDIFYLRWGKETLKENISILNDTFKIFITLDTILLSAYFGFYENVLGNLPSISWQRMLPALFVIIFLAASIIGIFPFPKSVNLYAPQEIKRYKEERTMFKSTFLVIAAFTLVCGFIVLLLARVFTVGSPNQIILPTVVPTP